MQVHQEAPSFRDGLCMPYMLYSLNPLQKAEHVLSETSRNFTWDRAGPYRIEDSWILPIVRVMVHLQVHKAAHAFPLRSHPHRASLPKNMTCTCQHAPIQVKRQSRGNIKNGCLHLPVEERISTHCIEGNVHHGALGQEVAPNHHVALGVSGGSSGRHWAHTHGLLRHHMLEELSSMPMHVSQKGKSMYM